MGREGGKEGEKHWCVRDTSISCPLHAPNWGPGPKPRHVPWPGIELSTFQFAAGIQSTQPCHPGVKFKKFKSKCKTILSLKTSEAQVECEQQAFMAIKAISPSFSGGQNLTTLSIWHGICSFSNPKSTQWLREYSIPILYAASNSEMNAEEWNNRF